MNTLTPSPACPQNFPFPFYGITQSPFLFLLLIAVLIAELALKGYALWKAGNNKDKVWFVCLFIFNTMGILPLVYLFIKRKR